MTTRLSEASIIQSLQQAFSKKSAHNLFGIGDDAAILENLKRGYRWVITQDALVEDVHFKRIYTTPEDWAYKLVHVNMSDAAAMGASPRLALMTMCVPRNENAHLIKRFISTLSKALKEYNIVLVGGDTTSSYSGLIFSLTILAEVKENHIKSRSGARSGDILVTIGHLGYSKLGLLALESGLVIDEKFIYAFKRPKALMQASYFLRDKRSVHALMDVSDGLYLDVLKLCQASNLGAHITLEEIPKDLLYTKTCKDLRIDPLRCLLEGGEDYALLCAMSARTYHKLRTEFQSLLPKEEWNRIGSFNASGKITFKDIDSAYVKNLSFFSHFGETSQEENCDTC